LDRVFTVDSLLVDCYSRHCVSTWSDWQICYWYSNCDNCRLKEVWYFPTVLHCMSVQLKIVSTRTRR